MNWLDPVFLFLAAAALLAAIFCWRIGAWRKHRALHALLGDFAEDHSMVLLSRSRRFFRHLLLGIAMLLLGITAARPYWKKMPVAVSTTGRDVLVLFDVSKSMRSTDLAPSRLEHARYLLREIVSAFPGDRFGLIAFAGKAFLNCPLTSDAVAFDQYVGELSTDSVPVGGTDLEAGFTTALRALQAAGGEDKTLLVLTDGEELTGNSARLIDAFKAAKVQLIIVGIGDAAGAPVLDDEGNFRRDAAGKIILTRLNEATLRQIAEACGGIYLHSTTADNSFAAIRRVLQANQKKVIAEMNRALPVENFTPPLLAVLAVLVIYFAVSERKKVLLFLVVLSVGILSGAETSASRYCDAVALQQQGEKVRAVAIYEQLLADPALSPELAVRVRQNLGVVPHETGRQSIADAKKEIEKQQLDAALQKLATCERSLNEAESYYADAFSGGATNFDQTPLLANLALLDADRREMAELKKKIEDLKKEQNQARDKAQQAKAQNQHQQNQTKPDSAGKDQQKKDPSSRSLDEAAQAAKQLAESADKMKQQNLRDAAKKAEKSLQDAKNSIKKGDRQKADQQIAEALAALGDEKGGEKSGARPDPGKKEEKSKAQKGEALAPKKEPSDPGKLENDRLLQQMLDRENECRRRLAPSRGNGVIQQVEKDW